MAKTPAKPRVVSVEIPADDQPPEELSPAEKAAEYAREAAGMSDDDAEDFFQGIDELRGTQGVTFMVNRTEPLERAGFCFEYPGGSFSLQRLTKDYGPGTYRVRVKGPGGRFIPGGGTLKIAEGTPVDERAAEQSSVQDMLAVLKADREKQSDATLKWVAALSPLLAPVLASMFSGKSQVTELVTALGALQGMAPKPEKPPDLFSQLDQVSAMMVKLKEMSGTETQPTGATWIDLVRDGITALRPAVEGIAAKALAGRAASPSSFPMTGPLALASPSTLTAPQPAAAALAAPGAAPYTLSAEAPAPAAAAPQTDPVLHLLAWLKATAEQLAEQARRDKDPEFYAEVVADNLPDGAQPAQLLEYLARADWWPMFSNFAPVAAPYQGWFTRFRDAFVELLKEQIPKTAAPQGSDPVPEPESFE